MNIKKLVLGIVFALGFTRPAFSAIPENIRIGTEASYAPFESLTPQGDVVGFDIDLANEMCRRMKANCTIIQTEYDGLIPSLKAKKIDAIIAAMSITPQRLKEIDFTNKLYAANARLIAEKGSPIQSEIGSLRGKRIGVQQGTTQDIYATKYWRPQGVDVISYQTQDLVFADLVAGRLDAAFQDEVAGSYGFLKQAAGKNYAFVRTRGTTLSNFSDTPYLHH